MVRGADGVRARSYVRLWLTLHDREKTCALLLQKGEPMEVSSVRKQSQLRCGPPFTGSVGVIPIFTI